MSSDISESDFIAAKAELVEIKQSADSLVDIYMKLYEDLNKLYDNHPKLYEKLQQTVNLPTNEDAENISKFSASLNTELSYFKDDEYLKSVLRDNFFEQGI